MLDLAAHLRLPPPQRLRQGRRHLPRRCWPILTWVSRRSPPMTGLRESASSPRLVAVHHRHPARARPPWQSTCTRIHQANRGCSRLENGRQQWSRVWRPHRRPGLIQLAFGRGRHGLACPLNGVGAARYWWTDPTATDPSPTAPATRLAEPWRTSPAAKMPGRLVSNE